MTIFEYLADIQVTKSCVLPVDEYSSYMIARWMSFYSPTAAQNINKSVNILNTNLDKTHHYKLMSLITPKTKHVKRINYIKKSAINKKEDDKTATFAKNLELSQRELQTLLEFKETYNKL